MLRNANAIFPQAQAAFISLTTHTATGRAHSPHIREQISLIQFASRKARVSADHATEPSKLLDLQLETRFNELKKYKDEHGNCIVNTQTGGSLGRWVAKGRREYKRGKLSLERIEQLDSIGFA